MKSSFHNRNAIQDRSTRLYDDFPSNASTTEKLNHINCPNSNNDHSNNNIYKPRLFDDDEDLEEEEDDDTIVSLQSEKENERYESGSNMKNISREDDQIRIKNQSTTGQPLHQISGSKRTHLNACGNIHGHYLDPNRNMVKDSYLDSPNMSSFHRRAEQTNSEENIFSINMSKNSPLVYQSVKKNKIFHYSDQNIHTPNVMPLMVVNEDDDIDDEDTIASFDQVLPQEYQRNTSNEYSNNNTDKVENETENQLLQHNVGKQRANGPIVSYFRGNNVSTPLNMASEGKGILPRANQNLASSRKKAILNTSFLPTPQNPPNFLEKKYNHSETTNFGTRQHQPLSSNLRNLRLNREGKYINGNLVENGLVGAERRDHKNMKRNHDMMRQRCEHKMLSTDISYNDYDRKENDETNKALLGSATTSAMKSTHSVCNQDSSSSFLPVYNSQYQPRRRKSSGSKKNSKYLLHGGNCINDDEYDTSDNENGNSQRDTITSKKRIAPSNETDQSNNRNYTSVSRFQSDFKLVSTIGEGTFGYVYKCKSLIDDCLYAVKCFRRSFRSEREREKMLEEVKALAKVTGYLENNVSKAKHRNKINRTHNNKTFLGSEEKELSSMKEDTPEGGEQRITKDIEDIYLDNLEVGTNHIVRYHHAWTEENRLYIQMELCETSLDKLPIYSDIYGKNSKVSASTTHESNKCKNIFTRSGSIEAIENSQIDLMKEEGNENLQPCDTDITRSNIRSKSSSKQVFDRTSSFVEAGISQTVSDTSDEENTFDVNKTVFSETDICDLLRQILLALKCLHNYPYVHLDIKPSNIFIKYSQCITNHANSTCNERDGKKVIPAEAVYANESSYNDNLMKLDNANQSNKFKGHGETPQYNNPISSLDTEQKSILKETQVLIHYKLGDFGLVTTISPSGRYSYIDEEGDSRYMPLDLMKEPPYQDLTKCDIFSLGMTAFELATRQPVPSHGEQYLDLRNNTNGILERTLQSIVLSSPSNTADSFVPPSYSSEFIALIVSMLRKDPLERPSATELLTHPLLLSDFEKKLLTEKKKNLKLEMDNQKLKEDLMKERAKMLMSRKDFEKNKFGKRSITWN